MLDGGNYDNYLWEPGGENSRFITITKAGLYTLRVGNTSGCYYSDSIRIKSICKPRLYIPDAFTPDGNGLNDVFKPYALSLQNYHMTIYNRWGERIFETYSTNEGWDGTFNGKEATPDIYIYIIDAKDLQNKRIVQKGILTLVR